MRRLVTPAWVLTAVLLLAAAASGVQRFPPPDFESGYEIPTMTQPHPAQTWRELADVGVLAAALALASYLAVWKRSRRSLAWLSVFSLVYFGFYRRGCICPVGSVQNVTLSLFGSGYVLPVTVAFFFALPLAFALLFGRVFCGAVCPLGAVQDVVLVKPVRVPKVLGQVLGMVPYVYLGLAVLFAATGTMFIICRYDPFVGFFRLSGTVPMLALGGVFLLTSTVVGRPYCRFLCPYSVLLSLCSRFAWRRVSITPDVCVQCSLCEDACPFDAILTPTPEPVREDS